MIAAAQRLTLKHPEPTPSVENRRAIVVEKVEPTKPVEPARVKGPAFTDRQWAPGRTQAAMRLQLGELLLEPVPAVFADDPIRPIALHSDKLLLTMARPGSRTRLKRWLGSWCKRHAYQVALASPGSVRCDLDGNPVEPVTDEQRAFAAATLASRMKQ